MFSLQYSLFNSWHFMASSKIKTPLGTFCFWGSRVFYFFSLWWRNNLCFPDFFSQFFAENVASLGLFLQTPTNKSNKSRFSWCRRTGAREAVLLFTRRCWQPLRNTFIYEHICGTRKIFPKKYAHELPETKIDEIATKMGFSYDTFPKFYIF